jgi:hypothetical protein
MKRPASEEDMEGTTFHVLLEDTTFLPMRGLPRPLNETRVCFCKMELPDQIAGNCRHVLNNIFLNTIGFFHQQGSGGSVIKTQHFAVIQEIDATSKKPLLRRPRVTEICYSILPHLRALRIQEGSGLPAASRSPQRIDLAVLRFPLIAANTTLFCVNQ